MPPAILDEARRRGCEGALGLIRACQGGSVKVGRRPRAQDIQKDVEGGAAALVDQEAALVKQLVQDDAVGVDVGGAATYTPAGTTPNSFDEDFCLVAGA